MRACRCARGLGRIEAADVVVRVLAALGNIDGELDVAGASAIAGSHNAYRDKVPFLPVGVTAVGIGVAFVTEAGGRGERRCLTTRLNRIADAAVLALADIIGYGVRFGHRGVGRVDPIGRGTLVPTGLHRRIVAGAEST